MSYRIIQGSIEYIDQQLDKEEIEGYKPVYFQNKPGQIDFFQVILHLDETVKDTKKEKDLETRLNLIEEGLMLFKDYIELKNIQEANKKKGWFR